MDWDPTTTEKISSIFSGSQNPKVGNQQITSFNYFLLLISLISRLVDLGILGDFEFDLGSSNLFHFHVYVYHYCYSCSPSLR